MSSNAITEKPSLPGGLPPEPDKGPSLVREDDLHLPRFLGMGGAMLVIFGGMALAFHLNGRRVALPFGIALILVVAGIAGLLFHAAFDRDVQFRRLYGFLSGGLLVLGAFLVLFPYVSKTPGLAGRFSAPMLVLALLFALAFLRNETDAQLRQIVQYVVGGAGAFMIVVGLGGGNVRGEFFLPVGLMLSLLGLVYVTAFVGSRGVSDDLAYRATLGLVAVGALVVLAAVVRSFIPSSTVGSYFKAYGFMLLVVGLLFAGAGALMSGDWPVAVLTRRELGAFFYSPMAYLTLFGLAAVSWVPYASFTNSLLDTGGAVIDPVVRGYVVDWFPVIINMMLVPVLTMRLLSEEYRSGTFEVLLTAPVSEVSVVLSKFLAALISYAVVWSPFWLYLLAIPLGGGNVFDYRPLVSFLIALLVTGGAFVSMGVFFSSLTNNQIAAFVLTFAGMLAMLAVLFLPGRLLDPGRTGWLAVFAHLSYIELWAETLNGKLTPRMLLFPLSMNVFFVFLSVKVLESRKWR